ncbi:MAG TPA: tetratricopeptide repeat protein, partial [Spirochaetia bacterium]|nr:tetratricopeptide repeat protein [Spirochaetia bacterium]
QQQIDQDPKNVSLVNKLGVLYARYGVLDKAEDAFTKALAIQEYPPALINMGNIMRGKNNLPEARRYYERAFAKTPGDGATLLNLAKITYEMGRFKETETYYGQLRKVDSLLADRFSYLGAGGDTGSARAANAEAMKDEMVWGE